MKKAKRKLVVLLLPFLFPVIMICSVSFLFAGVLLTSSTSNTSSVGSLTGNAAAIYRKLIAVPGVKPQGVVAIMGNWFCESGLDPSAIQDHSSYDEKEAMNPNLNGYAFGLGQWDGPRRVALLNFAKSQGKSWSDLDVQLDFALNDDGSNSEALKEVLIETDVAQATKHFYDMWERGPGYLNIQPRIDKATEYYQATLSGSTPVKSGAISGTVPAGFEVSDPPPNTSFPSDPYPWGQCTWYVYGRALQFGIEFSPQMGNGGDWQYDSGYEVTTTPTLHAAVSFSPGQAGAIAPYGHVAFVEQVKSDGSILISQSNADGKLGVISYQVFSAAEAKQFHYVIGK